VANEHLPNITDNDGLASGGGAERKAPGRFGQVRKQMCQTAVSAH